MRTCDLHGMQTGQGVEGKSLSMQVSNVVLKTPQRKVEDVDSSVGVAALSMLSPHHGRSTATILTATAGSVINGGTPTSSGRPRWAGPE